MTVKSFSLDVRFGPAITCRVLLNGVTVALKRSGDAEAHSLAIQHEVVPGSNHIAFLIGSAAIPAESGALAAPVPASAAHYLEADLSLEDTEEFEDRYEITTYPLEDLVWRPAGTITLPHRESLSFTAPPDTSRPAWLDGAPVAAGEVMGAVAAALEQLRTALVERDLVRFQSLMTVRNRDMALAYPLVGDSRQRAAIDSEMLAQILEDGARVADIPRDLEITTEADGRLIIARTATGGSPLRVQPANGSPEIPLAVSFAAIGGAIRPIR